MPGVGLSAEGMAQTAALAERFSGMALDAILSSPIERARQTAAAIGTVLDLEVGIDAGLNEIDFGAWTGAALSALDGSAAWDAWNRQRSIARCPGGETMAAAQDRALTAIAHARRYRQVAMVSHQDILKSVLAHYLGLSLDHLHRFALDPASHSVVTVFDDGTARVDAVNRPL